MNVPDAEFRPLLEKYKRFSVYGLSPEPEKPSHYVPLFMREKGWQMVGTYPRPHHEGGFQIYKSLAEVPAEYRRFVDVFRASDRLDQVVDEALSVGGVEVLWFQLGIHNASAEARAEKAGIRVVSNRCLIVEYKNWFS